MHPVTISLFGWLVLVVYDRKFPAGIVFFSHTNQPVVLLHEPATIQTSQPNRLNQLGRIVYYGSAWKKG